MLPALGKMRAAGFEVALSAAGGLMIRPIDRLTDAQRQWLKANRAALLAALASEQPAPAPLLPADEARIRRYLTRIGEVDPVTIAELLDVCRRDAEARINTLALAIESESQPAPPPPPPKLAARQTPEQRQRCFAARVGEFMRAGMTHEEATAATAKEGW